MAPFHQSMIPSTIEQVAKFHHTMNQPINVLPAISDTKVNLLRVNLIKEETQELALALCRRDAIGVLDALTDLQYVLDSAYLSLGFHAVKDFAFAEVHRSNMTKLENGKPLIREDGKIVKGPSYTPPDLKQFVPKHYH